MEITYADAADIARETSVFKSTAVVMTFAGIATALDPPERIEGYDVSVSLFDTLGVQPMLGRGFAASEGEPGKDNVVILSYGFWQRQFAGADDVVGKTIQINGQPVEVVGVMREDFLLNKEVMPTVNKISNAEMLLSLPMGWGKRTTRTNEDYNIFGKLKDGDLVRIIIDRNQLVGSVDLIGDGRQQFSPAEGANILAQRSMHPDLKSDPDLPDDTRLWAALQRIGGGAWSGCVYDVDRILETLVAGEKALRA